MDSDDQRGPGIDGHATRRTGWIAYLILSGAALTLALAWVAPSASEGLGTLNRLVFWAVHVAPALILCAATQVLLGRLGLFDRMAEIVQVGLSGIAAAVLFTPVALLLDRLFPDAEPAPDPPQPLGLELVIEFAQLSVPVALAWVLLNTPSLIDIRRRDGVPAGLSSDAPDLDQTAQPNTPAATPPDPALDADEVEFWSRLPRRLGRNVVAMRAELHYLRVYTDQGEALILFGFGRAVRLIEARQSGMQIHRSHWIGLDHVDELDTSGGNMICRLVTGLTLPVSRKNRTPLRQTLKARAALD